MWYTSLKISWGKVKEYGSNVLVSPTISRSTDDRAKGSIPSLFAVSRDSPPRIPRNREKKGGSIWRRSKDERQSIPGGGVSALGVLSKDIYADEVTSTISHCLDLPQHCGVFCTFGSVGWVCTHHFIPLRHDDRVFVPLPRFREFLRVCRTNWILFRIQVSVHSEYSEFGSHFSYLMYLYTRTSTWHVRITRRFRISMYEADRKRNDRNVLK